MRFAVSIASAIHCRTFYSIFFFYLFAFFCAVFSIINVSIQSIDFDLLKKWRKIFKLNDLQLQCKWMTYFAVNYLISRCWSTKKKTIERFSQHPNECSPIKIDFSPFIFFKHFIPSFSLSFSFLLHAKRFLIYFMIWVLHISFYTYFFAFLSPR